MKLLKTYHEAQFFTVKEKMPLQEFGETVLTTLKPKSGDLSLSRWKTVMQRKLQHLYGYIKMLKLNGKTQIWCDLGLRRFGSLQRRRPILPSMPQFREPSLRNPKDIKPE